MQKINGVLIPETNGEVLRAVQALCYMVVDTKSKKAPSKEKVVEKEVTPKPKKVSKK